MKTKPEKVYQLVDPDTWEVVETEYRITEGKND